MNIKRKIEWIITFSCLGLFTIWAGAASAMPKHQLLAQTNLNNFHSKNVVYFEGKHGKTGHEEYVCSITQSQLSTLQAKFKVQFITRTEDGKTIKVAVVSASNARAVDQVKDIVGARKSAICKSHEYKSILYFFTIPSLS